MIGCENIGGIEEKSCRLKQEKRKLHLKQKSKKKRKREKNTIFQFENVNFVKQINIKDVEKDRNTKKKEWEQ